MSTPAPVQTTATKAYVAAFVSAIGTLATGLVVLLPDDPTIQLVGGALGLLATIVGSAYAVYSAENKPLEGPPAGDGLAGEHPGV